MPYSCRNLYILRVAMKYYNGIDVLLSDKMMQTSFQAHMQSTSVRAWTAARIGFPVSTCICGFNRRHHKEAIYFITSWIRSPGEAEAKHEAKNYLHGSEV